MNEVHRCPLRSAERTHHLVELHDRIRELEAELAEEHRQNVRNLARAEKAEKALEVAEAQVYRWSAGQRDTEQRLADSEARVSELESKEDRCVYPDCQGPLRLAQPSRNGEGDV